MSSATLNSLMRVKWNGPPITQLDVNAYTDEYLAAGKVIK